jgi:hypothetical protein
LLPDLFRRLKPLYGTRIDELWIAYQLGTPADKQAIEEVLTILAVKRLGIAIGDEKIVLEPPPPTIIGGGEFTIGNVAYPGLPPYSFTLYRKELLRHVFVLGPSGTGKSTLIIGLLRQFLRDRLSFWCVDFKRNYRCLLHDEHAAEVVVFTVGRNTTPLRVNMLRPPTGVEQSEWADALTDTISAAYLLMQGARNVLKEALLSASTNCGRDATLRDALDHLKSQLATARSGSRRYGWLESSYRSLEELTKGALGQALNATNGTTLEDLLLITLVFELQGLGEDQKKCFCLYLLQAVLLLRKHQPEEREVLRHVLVFDEAQNVFPKDQWGTLSISSRLAREVREYGEGIIAATQQADVADSLIANSGIKLILRTDYPKDVDFASKLLQIDARWLPKIPLGQGIARLPTRYYQPFLFAFPEQPLKNTLVSDKLVAERYVQWQGCYAQSQGKETAHPTPDGPVPTEQAPLSATSTKEETLLLDIAKWPISTVTERYQRLGWNPKTGNAIKNCIIRKGFAEFFTLDVQRGRVKLLSVTPAGEGVVRNAGGAVRRSGRAGMEHEFWRSRLKDRCEARGYTVTEEVLVGDGKRADLFAQRDGKAFLIEVETGKSDAHANIAKCAGASAPLVVFFTTSRALEETLAHGPVRSGVVCLTPETLVQLSDLLG